MRGEGYGRGNNITVISSLYVISSANYEEKYARGYQGGKSRMGGKFKNRGEQEGWEVYCQCQRARGLRDIGRGVFMCLK